jgi:hypothetical protein
MALWSVDGFMVWMDGYDGEYGIVVVWMDVWYGRGENGCMVWSW